MNRCHGVAGTVWDSSFVLARYLEKSLPVHSLTDQSRILELGAGLGLVGIAMAKLLPNARIVLTDKHERLKLLQYNVHANESSAQVEGLDWDANNPDIEGQQWDAVLISDCIWEPSLHDSLLHALEKVVNSSSTLIMAYEQRDNTIEQQFFDKFHSIFDSRIASSDEMDDEYQSNDIKVVIAYKKELAR
jgi:predicted nicotinamide N-methyase